MNIELTAKEKEMLKQYALLFDEEAKRHITRNPLPTVEIKVEVRTDEDDAEYALYVNGEDTYRSNKELREGLESKGYTEEQIEGLLDDLNTYNESLEFDGFEKVYIRTKYQPVAYFLTIKEAEDYIRYQGHNLTNPRVYIYSMGYSNEGDLVHLYPVLLKMGKKLLCQK